MDALSEKEHNDQQIHKLLSIDIPICRICLNEQFTEDNPLVSPCKCAGTMQNVHIACLRGWYYIYIYIYALG